MASSRQHTQGIVLRRVEYGEADRIITWLTKDHGLITTMAKGVRRPKSKLAGGVELLSVVEIDTISGRSDMATLVSARAATIYSDILTNYDSMQLAYSVLDHIYQLTKDAQIGSDVFELLQTILYEINAAIGAKVDIAVIESWALLQLSLLFGHTPNLSTDISGEKLQKNTTYDFSPEDGCFVLSKVGKLNSDHITAWRLLLTSPPSSLRAVRNLADATGVALPRLRMFAAQQMQLRIG